MNYKGLDKWVESQGRHFCFCGCGSEIKIQKHHHIRGIPKYIKNHYVKDIEFDKWVLENQGNHCCSCGCHTPIRIEKRHKRLGIPKFICGHNRSMIGKETMDWVNMEQGKHVCRCGCKQLILVLPTHKTCGVPEYISGHNLRFERVKIWLFNELDRKGKLVLMEKTVSRNKSAWSCKCDCGKVKIILEDSIVFGTRSCGCNRCVSPKTREMSKKRLTGGKLSENHCTKLKISGRKAWADGKHTNHKVGYCKWYSYQRSNGQIVRVQGKYELAFVKWADRNGLCFVVHEGLMKYLDDDGVEHTYFPDFYVFDWDCWVDIKSVYSWKISKHKLLLVKKFNMGERVKILRENHLKELGVEEFKNWVD